MVERKNAKLDTGRPDRESTESERAVREQVRRRQSVTPAPNDGAQSSATSPDHPNEADDYGPLMKALGTTDVNFAKGLFRQLFHASARGDDRFDGDGLCFSLALIKSKKPKDELEAMQLAQMAFVHAAIIRLTGQLARAETLPQQDSAIRGINQLARTYTDQLERFKRNRAGAEQKVTVQQNVSVNDGGQAIVGAVTQATHGIAPEEVANATPALTDARQPAMKTIGASELVTIPLRVKQKI